MTLLRSNVEASKRVFLDRLTTDQQPLGNPQNLDGGPGDEYVYANVGDTNNFGIGFDCSGWCGVGCATALFGLSYWVGVGYQRLFSTETFVNWANSVGGWKQTTQADLVNGDYPIKVMIMHGGGGPDSHMAMWLDGWNMESNGDYGLCTEPGEITGVASSFWNDWWVYTNPITEDTTYRTPMTYPQGLDYAGGYIAGADLAAAGISFVCRYVTSGGSELPQKQLTPAEFADLADSGIGVVFNWEYDASGMLNGAAQGTADAQTALANVLALPGIPDGYQPVIYFSADFDATEDNQTPINAYLSAAAQVLGGPQFVGIYGGYWPLSRALDAGVCQWAWQTEAWSGDNVDSRINIMQRNSLGYKTVDGVQADIDEAHTDNFGQYLPGGTVVTPPSSNPPAIPKPTDEASQDSELWDQELLRWDFLGNRTVAETIGAIAAALKVSGCTDPLGGNS